jgi:transposase InsO family protein
VLALIDEAQKAGARLCRCCDVVGLDVRTIQRWRVQGIGEDKRQGPKMKPHNALSEHERKKVLSVCQSPEFRDSSPKQIVPKMADRGTFIASESTFYRVLKDADQQHHRGRSKPPTKTRPKEYCATGPNQVWSWDITYLRSPIRGLYFYLYLVVDVWSRKIVAHTVHERECSELASSLFKETLTKENLQGPSLVVHQDNGSPMKGATLKATLEKLGVIASYSRPSVSNDNAFSESLFRTMKYRPAYPSKPFATIEDARRWVEDFVHWYNNEHFHSAIGFVTPTDRHNGNMLSILAKRKAVYQQARRRNPQRWSRTIRKWDSPKDVYLNPAPSTMCHAKRG